MVPEHGGRCPVSLCTYCGQGGHAASSCPRRAKTPSQRRLNAESAFRAIARRPLVIEKRKSRKVDPAKLAEWLADLEVINRELSQ